MQEPINKEEINTKLEELKSYLHKLERVAVAFSSGVDSTFLLKVAHQVLGDNIIAITATSPLFPVYETENAKAFCKKEGISLVLVESDELKMKEFCSNPTNRCYICKHKLFSSFIKIAKEHNIEHLLEGSNIDDTKDYRPGLLAISELNVKSPLLYCKLTKSQIRYLSKELGLPTYNKQSSACLASRIPYGQLITEKKLSMIQKAESFLSNFNLGQLRVRLHDESLARIEVKSDKVPIIINYSQQIQEEFRSYGFNYITLDLQGYRTGSMNEVIKDEQLH